MASEPGRAGVAVTGRRWLLIGLAGAAIALLVARGLAQIYTDYLWFAALGAADVWRAKYGALAALRITCAVVATGFVFANLYAVRQSVVSLVLPRRIGNLDIGEEVPRRQLTWTAAAMSALIGVALAWSQRDWSALLAARIGQPFGEADPFFAADLGFFVYRLPLELSLFTWTLTVVLVVIALVVTLYALTPSLRWEQGALYVSGYVRRHLAMLAGVLLLTLAWYYRLRMFTILSDGDAMEGAFGYLDHRVGIPASLVLSLVTLGAGLTVLWAGWTGQLRLVFAALTGVILAALAARQVAPFIARRTVAERDPVVRERPYEATRAGYTRRAFAVDRVQTGDSTLVFATLADAAPYVPVWDEAALRRATERAVIGAAAGWSVSDSAVFATIPSAGSGGSLATFDAAATDDNGNPARATTVEAAAGSPAMLILPESTARPIIVADSTNAIAGPQLSGRLVRLAHALSMQDFRVWFAAPPSPTPRLLSRRTVRERVEALAPYFVQGTTISPLWSGGQLVWALDLYSSSTTYPLSRRVMVAGAEHAYFQHAATALVNAATGHTELVIDSLTDPVARTWMVRFPGLFRRAAAKPMVVRRQLPAARDGARAQAIAFGRYGPRGASDAARHPPGDDGPDSALVLSPSPLLGFPRAGASGYVQPLLDRSERLRGLFITLGGPSPRAVWLPAGERAPAWREVTDRLRAADTITASHLVRGYVRAVPLAGDVALVQPRYEWRGSGAPRLLYVSATIGDSVRTAGTLLELAGRPPAAAPLGAPDFQNRVMQLYEEMRRAMARGDWTAYGRAFDALGVLLGPSRRQERR